MLTHWVHEHLRRALAPGDVHARGSQRRGDRPVALDALAGVDVLLDRDFIRRASLELSTDAHVGTFGVFAHHDEIEFAGGAESFAGYRRGDTLLKGMGAAWIMAGPLSGNSDITDEGLEQLAKLLYPDIA